MHAFGAVVVAQASVVQVVAFGSHPSRFIYGKTSKKLPPETIRHITERPNTAVAGNEVSRFIEQSHPPSELVAVQLRDER